MAPQIESKEEIARAEACEREHVKRRELEAERDYLLCWLGGFEAPLTGLSADTLTLVAFGFDPEFDPHLGFTFPLDKGDLGRCERAYAAMPPHLQENALPLLETWQDALEDPQALDAAEGEGRR